MGLGRTRTTAKYPSDLFRTMYYFANSRDRELQVQQSTNRMSKRAAEYELDEKNPGGEAKEKNPEPINISTPEQIAARRIVKVKRDDADKDTKTDTPASKIQFNLLGSEQKQAEGSESKEATKQKSIFSNSDFSSIFKNSGDTVQPTLFGSLFPQSSAQQTPNFTLFSTDNKSTNLFANSGTIPASNLFKNAAEAGATSGTGLFSGLTSGAPTKSSLFNFEAGVPPTGQAGGGSDEEGSGDDDVQQEEKFDPSKSTGTYKYESAFEKKVSRKAQKFRLNANQVVENIDAAIQLLKENQSVFVTIRNSITKTLLYQGQVIRTVSVSKPISGGGDSVELKVFGINKETGKPSADIVRLKFEDKQGCVEFSKQFDDASKP